MKQRSKRQRQIGYRVGASIALLLTLALVQFGYSPGAQAQEGQVFLPFFGGGEASTTIRPNLPEANAPVVSEEADGTINVSIPDGDLPSESSSTLLAAGSGPAASMGDEVVVHWEMFSWSTGERVESSRVLGEAISMELGSDGVPSFLQEALVGATAGSRLLVTFEQGMADLPAYFDQNDAYVLVVDVAAANGYEVMAAAAKDGCLAGLTWEDANADGFRINSDGPIAGIPVQLIDGNGDVVDSAMTNSNGRYKLCGEPGGGYKVGFEIPQQCVDYTIPNNGTNPAYGNQYKENRDSDADGSGFAPTAPDGSAYTILEGVKTYNIDAGYVCDTPDPTPTPEPPTPTPTDVPPTPTPEPPTPTPTDVPPTPTPTDIPPTPTPSPLPACFPVSAVPGRITFGYENMPAGSFVLRNGGVLLGPISGNGTFEDAPGVGTFTYAIQAGANVFACGDFTVDPTPTPEPPTPTPTPVPPTPTPEPPTPTPKPPTTPPTSCVFNNTYFFVFGDYNSTPKVPDKLFVYFNGGHSPVATFNNPPGGYPVSWPWRGSVGGYYFTVLHYPDLTLTTLDVQIAVQKGHEKPSKKIVCGRGPTSPMALDIDGSGSVERMDGEFNFDMTGNGEIETVSEWFAPTEGILIDTSVEGFAAGELNGQHLFGDLGGTYADGFEKLALLDANADGQVSGPETANLAIWTDANSNAKLDEGEVSSLASHSIVSLSTSHVGFVSQATLADGSTMLMEDLWFPIVAVAGSTPASAPVSVPVAATAAAVALLLAGAAALYGGSRRRKALDPTV